jgi:hypothetical protein
VGSAAGRSLDPSSDLRPYRITTFAFADALVGAVA